MMNIDENRSKTWFKVLSKEGKPIDGAEENWSLPKGGHKGEIQDYPNKARCPNSGKWSELPNVNGTWLVTDPKYLIKPEDRIFIAELVDLPDFELPGIIWVPKVRLVREATNRDLTPFGIIRVITHPYQVHE